jgi:GTP diphosphokinase / guanosine-3',5'-bis(diphosphate) 3'-diphosphatase
MNASLRLLKAADAAARWHVHQLRKGSAQEPYINHLIEAAMLVADATGGSDTNLVIAALLHDTIEDCEVPRELIVEMFDDDVASLVVEVTDDQSLPKEIRKRKQVESTPRKSARAKLLKLADKISNLRALAASPPATWSIGRREQYLEWSREVVRGLRGINQQLEDRFDEAAVAAEQSFKSTVRAEGNPTSSPIRSRRQTSAKKSPAVQRAFARAAIIAGLRSGDKGLVKAARDLLRRASNPDQTTNTMLADQGSPDPTSRTSRGETENGDGSL